MVWFYVHSRVTVMILYQKGVLKKNCFGNKVAKPKKACLYTKE